MRGCNCGTVHEDAHAPGCSGFAVEYHRLTADNALLRADNARLREALTDASMALGCASDVLRCGGAPEHVAPPLNNHWCSQCDEYVDRNGNERQKVEKADERVRAALAATDSGWLRALVTRAVEAGDQNVDGGSVGDAKRIRPLTEVVEEVLNGKA